ncbi:hypothetical protein C8J57DRAFT_1237094 [Mycena rebaudengoi]|nr:hypothetical protein C8J57DRAFT_1237094 [Mycena rebaudengoi]
MSLLNNMPAAQYPNRNIPPTFFYTRELYKDTVALPRGWATESSKSMKPIGFERNTCKAAEAARRLSLNRGHDTLYRATDANTAPKFSAETPIGSGSSRVCHPYTQAHDQYIGFAASSVFSLAQEQPHAVGVPPGDYRNDYLWRTNGDTSIGNRTPRATEEPLTAKPESRPAVLSLPAAGKVAEARGRRDIAFRGQALTERVSGLPEEACQTDSESEEDYPSTPSLSESEPGIEAVQDVFSWLARFRRGEFDDAMSD